jgi:predicted secreted acid phosphatase
MIKKSSTFISGVLAFTAYFIIIGLLIFYFNTRSEDKSKHFVKKDEHRIQVALSGAEKKTKTVKKTKPKPKARNPRTGEIIYVPARRKTHFKAGKLLKDVLKESLPEA